MQLTQRQKFRRRRIVVFSATALVLATAFYLPITLLAPLEEAQAQLLPIGVSETTEPVLSLPSYGASAIAALDRTGTLGQAGSEDSLPIASITKVITSLVVLDARPLAVDEAGPTITFGEIDLDYYYTQQAELGLVWPVENGQQLTQRHVLDVVLLASANNYAQSLAHWAFGSEDAFVAAAASWLADNGLNDTSLTEASGIEESNRSTARDLVELARLAIANPVVAEIVGTVSVNVPGLGEVENRNQLLGVDGVDGIKTGTLDDDWACLLFATDLEIGGEIKTFVGVVLGGPDHVTVRAAIRSLIADARAGYVERSLVESGDAFAEYDTPWGDETTAVAAESLSEVVWASDEISMTVDAADVRLTQAGESAGVLTVLIGTEKFEVPLVFADKIEDPGPWWRLTNPQSLF